MDRKVLLTNLKVQLAKEKVSTIFKDSHSLPLSLVARPEPGDEAYMYVLVYVTLRSIERLLRWPSLSFSMH